MRMLPVYLLLLMLPLAAPAAETATPAPAADARAATQAALRELWVEHIFWTRNYVLAHHAGDEARATVAVEQVVANARAISAAIVPFYGDAAGEALFGLLAGHWGAVRAHADATIAGDAAAAAKAGTALESNAREIAAFLANANPHLPQPALTGLLLAHGSHHVAQDRQIVAGEHAAEARTWAAMRGHMHTIADALTDGLARQFPDRF